MVDVDSFLQNGYWQSTRAKTPEPPSHDDLDIVKPITRSSYVGGDAAAPRRLPYRLGPAHAQPPPPCVEDEEDSLAKEHGSSVINASSEEPLHRGEPEQYPILELVHEHNPERRFVIVADNSGDEGTKTPPKKPQHTTQPNERQPAPEPAYYEANTTRKYDPTTPLATKDANANVNPVKRQSSERLRGRSEDLTRQLHVETDSEPVRLQRQRSKSGAGRYYEADGPNVLRPAARLQPETTLSPDVIVNVQGGRDRTYRGRDRADYINDQPYRGSQDDRKYVERTYGQVKNTSPTNGKRVSILNLDSRTPREPYEKPHRLPDLPRPLPNQTPSPPRHARGTVEAISQRPSGYYREPRGSPPYDDRHSSDEDSRRKLDTRRRRTSFSREDKNDASNTLMGPRPNLDQRKPKPKVATTYKSPRRSFAHSPEKDRSTGPRAATFPRESRSSGDEDRPERPVSRGSASKSAVNASASIAVPAVLAAATAAAGADSANTVDPRKSPIPPPPHTSSARSSSTTLSSSPPKASWPPSKFEPAPNDLRVERRPITSYRRFSEDVRAGELPDIPDCPRTRPVAGLVDWLTLPRTDNFNICPTCYQASFSKTEFAHLFVPAPFRALDRPIACDFGSSRWNHLGWLFTRKYRKLDLGLFHQISRVAAKNQACNGFQEVNRSWLSIRDPYTRRTIPNFKVCHHCAQILEVLLPNLTGLFVPVDNLNGPSLGICDMHPQGERRRFVMYFDALEGESDQALAAQRAPDVQAIADRVGELSAIPECRGGIPIHNASWHTMRSIPDLSVCDECFHEVVMPALDYRDPSPIAGNFLERRQRLPVAACQLYSPRMREIFTKANRRRDMGYLEMKFRERLGKEQEYHAQVVGLDRATYGSAWADEEVERLTKEWKRWE